MAHAESGADPLLPVIVEGRLTQRIRAHGDRWLSDLAATNTLRRSGRITEILGPMARAEINPVQVGEMVELLEPGRGVIGQAEVVGFDHVGALIAPVGTVQGLSMTTEAVPLGRMHTIKVDASVLGALLDAQGVAKRRFAQPALAGLSASWRPSRSVAPDPLTRGAIGKTFVTGVRAIDALLTCGVGQRTVVIGNAGAGKSTLVSQILASSQSDAVVLGLVGERGREVAEMCETLAKSGAMPRTAIVASTSDRPPIERMNGAFCATAIAEYFRDNGLNVLLIIDSLTRFARAAREIGLSRGEPPVRRGFPPSVFDELPRLLERAGANEKGAITAFYTVLAEGEAEFDPLVDEIKALVDGHIILSSQLAAKGQFPAINVLQSRSRVMEAVAAPAHLKNARVLRELMSRYDEIEILLRVGEYKVGQDAFTDKAVHSVERIKKFLNQSLNDVARFPETLKALERLV